MRARETVPVELRFPTTEQPPTTAQIGTVASEGAVTVIAPPVTPSGRWVQMVRSTADTSPASFQGNLTEVRGDGRYTFSATVFMPASTAGVATIQFERKNQPLGSITNFLHLDLMPNNKVRIDDLAATEFGVFPRDKPFIVQVTLDIGAYADRAHRAVRRWRVGHGGSRDPSA
jgi:hypothetical protein